MKRRVTALSIVSTAMILIVFMLLTQRSNSIHIHFVQAPLRHNAFYTYQEAYQQLKDLQLINQLTYKLPGSSPLTASEIKHVVTDNSRSMHLIQLALSQPYIQPPVTPLDPSMLYYYKFIALMNLLEIEQKYFKHLHKHFSAIQLYLDEEKLCVQLPHNTILICDLMPLYFLPRTTRCIAAELPYLNKQQLKYCISCQSTIISLQVPYYKIMETDRNTKIAELENEISTKIFTTVMNDYTRSSFHPGLKNAAFDLRYIMTGGANVVRDEWDTLNFEIAICRPGASQNLIQADTFKLKQIAATDPIVSIRRNLWMQVKTRHDYGVECITSLMSMMKYELSE